MTDRKQNIVLSGTLLVLGVAWSWLVVDTIPSGLGDDGIGPRAFPLVLGLILIAFSLLLLGMNIHPLFSKGTGIAAEAQTTTKIYWRHLALVFIEISAYGFLLEKCGFLIATPVVVLLVLLISLRVRSWKTLLAMPLGLTAGCWLVFQKILGIYLASGTWINLG